MAGSWSEPMDWGEDVVVHISHLPTGKFLVWGAGDFNNMTTPDARLWNPNTEQFEDVPYEGTNLFCAGHTHDADGNLIVLGSAFDENEEEPYPAYPNAVIFDPFEEEWIQLEDMNYARWYPTVFMLPNGQIAVFSGVFDTTYEYVTIPELFENNEWIEKTSADTSGGDPIWLYPQLFTLTQSDKAFYAGGSNNSRHLDLDEWEWGSIIQAQVNRSHGSTIMFEPGKIIRSGGSTTGENGDGTKTIDHINLTGGGPYSWGTSTNWNMAYERRNHNLVILPDGTIASIGGNKNGNDPDEPPNNEPEPVYAAEILNPFVSPLNWQWQTHASMSVPRWYHSVAILMLDGRVLAAGGNWKIEWGENPLNFNDTRSAEIFSPPYLDDGFGNKRPGVNNVPSSIGYGSTFTIQAIPVSGTSIYKASLVKLGSVTHGFDAGQRFMWLNMTPDQYVAGEWHVDEPSNANYAPP